MHSNAVQALAGGTISALKTWTAFTAFTARGRLWVYRGFGTEQFSPMLIDRHDDKGQILMSKKLLVPPNSLISISKIKLVLREVSWLWLCHGYLIYYSHPQIDPRILSDFSQSPNSPIYLFLNVKIFECKSLYNHHWAVVLHYCDHIVTRGWT